MMKKVPVKLNDLIGEIEIQIYETALRINTRH
jgi:hypothetical protein